MTDPNLLKKMNVLVPHWLEHNEEHIAELQKYSQALETEGQTVLAEGCGAAIARMRQVSEALSAMREQLDTTHAGK